MKDNVYRFRTVKWGDPQQKLKMIPDELGRSRWLIVVIAFAVGIAGGLFLF
jgi:hypothetical protein